MLRQRNHHLCREQANWLPASLKQDEQAMTETRTTNPMRGSNKFKLGVFSANCDGGLTMSLAPERWSANWDDIAAMCQIADRAGMEFILPVAKWRGYQGKANIYGKSFETMTHSAAIGAITKQICVFSTIHVPLVTPAFAAKAIATIDHITHGRAGLNIVCGWNQDEFDLHGVTIEQDRRYERGLEWFRVWSRLLDGGPEFDWDGEFFHLKRLQTDPVSVQRPRPAVMSAGFSPKGRDFAAQEAVIQSRNCCLPGAGCRFFDTVAAGRPQRGVRDRAVPTPGDGGSASCIKRRRSAGHAHAAGYGRSRAASRPTAPWRCREPASGQTRGSSSW